MSFSTSKQSEKSNAPRCFLCNKCFQEGEESWLLFYNDTEKTNSPPLFEVLSKIVENDIDEETAHSKYLCECCTNQIDEYEQLERQIKDLGIKIQNNYKTTILQFGVEVGTQTEGNLELCPIVDTDKLVEADKAKLDPRRSSMAYSTDDF